MGQMTQQCQALKDSDFILVLLLLVLVLVLFLVLLLLLLRYSECTWTGRNVRVQYCNSSSAISILSVRNVRLRKRIVHKLLHKAHMVRGEPYAAILSSGIFNT